MGKSKLKTFEDDPSEGVRSVGRTLDVPSSGRVGDMPVTTADTIVNSYSLPVDCGDLNRCLSIVDGVLSTLDLTPYDVYPECACYLDTIAEDDDGDDDCYYYR